MTTLADDNTPYKLLVEQGSTPSSPGAGKQKVFIDSSDHKLKRVNSSGTVTSMEGSAVVDDTAYDATTWNGDTTHAPSKNAVRDKIEAMGSAGAATTNEYVTTASAGDLSAEVNIPGLAGSADISGAAGAGVSYEFDSGASPLTWSAAVDVETVDSTIKSCLYIQDNGATETLGTYSWSPAGAFDIRCKISLGSEVGTSASEPTVGLIAGDSSMANRATIFLSFLGSADSFRVRAFTYASSTYTQRGATNIVGQNWCYLRIVRDGSNNNSFYYSMDGLTWLLIATQALTYTAAKAGILVLGASLVTNVAVDWIRSDV